MATSSSGSSAESHGGDRNNLDFGDELAAAVVLVAAPDNEK